MLGIWLGWIRFKQVMEFRPLLDWRNRQSTLHVGGTLMHRQVPEQESDMWQITNRGKRHVAGLAAAVAARIFDGARLGSGRVATCGEQDRWIHVRRYFTNGVFSTCCGHSEKVLRPVRFSVCVCVSSCVLCAPRYTLTRGAPGRWREPGIPSRSKGSDGADSWAPMASGLLAEGWPSSHDG